MQAPLDFDVRQSLRVLQLNNRALWLPDKDTSWHLPILATLRETMLRNWRQRTEAGSRNQIDRARNFRQRTQERQVFKGKGKGSTTSQQSRVSESASSSSTSQAQASSSTHWAPTVPWWQDDRRYDYGRGYQQQYQQRDDQQQQQQQWHDRDWYGNWRWGSNWWDSRR